MPEVDGAALDRETDCWKTSSGNRILRLAEQEVELSLGCQKITATTKLL